MTPPVLGAVYIVGAIAAGYLVLRSTGENINYEDHREVITFAWFFISVALLWPIAIFFVLIAVAVDGGPRGRLG